ncbi:MAG: hypothetical protein LBL52_01875 [Rickettsiales bacterium]|jgi:hypothetical protein|nr:hypothetical protein [Rickettsiales bacterium]
MNKMSSLEEATACIGTPAAGRWNLVQKYTSGDGGGTSVGPGVYRLDGFLKNGGNPRFSSGVIVLDKTSNVQYWAGSGAIALPNAGYTGGAPGPGNDRVVSSANQGIWTPGITLQTAIAAYSEDTVAALYKLN